MAFGSKLLPTDGTLLFLSSSLLAQEASAKREAIKTNCKANDRPSITINGERQTEFVLGNEMRLKKNDINRVMNEQMVHLNNKNTCTIKQLVRK